MKRTATWILSVTLAFSPLVALAKPLTKTVTTTSGGGVPTTSTHIHQDDGPAVGDPGGSGVSPKADQGPANTQKYCAEGSTAEHCVRAARRHTSPTSWQQDCATGLSLSCGYR